MWTIPYPETKILNIGMNEKYEVLTMKAINIVWDTDGENVELPSEIELPFGTEVKYRKADPFEYC